MGHACEFETSMMLALRPDLVRRDEIKDDPPNDEPGAAAACSSRKTWSSAPITAPSAIPSWPARKRASGFWMRRSAARRKSCEALLKHRLPPE